MCVYVCVCVCACVSVCLCVSLCVLQHNVGITQRDPPSPSNRRRDLQGTDPPSTSPPGQPPSLGADAAACAGHGIVVVLNLLVVVITVAIVPSTAPPAGGARTGEGRKRRRGDDAGVDGRAGDGTYVKCVCFFLFVWCLSGLSVLAARAIGWITWLGGMVCTCQRVARQGNATIVS